MAEQPTPIEPAESEDERRQEANLALLVAALGGGPGDWRDPGVRAADETVRHAEAS